MKLFQQLLVAPAALGLLAPLAVVNSPAANAAELNINGVSDYAATASGNSLDQRGSASRRCVVGEVRPPPGPTRCPLLVATTSTMMLRVGIARDPAQITAIYGLKVKALLQRD